MQGSFFSENIFLIIGFIITIIIVFPLMIFSVKKIEKNQKKSIEKIAKALNGQIIDGRQEGILADQENIVFERNGCRYLINPFSPLLSGGISTDTKTHSSIYIEAEFYRSTYIEFEAKYHHHRVQLIGKNKFNEKYINIIEENAFEKFVGYDNFVNFVKSIDFKFSPDLVLKIKDNKLQLYFAKMKQDINEWKRYMEFFNSIVNKINQIS